MSFCKNPNCPQPNHPDNDKNCCQSCGSSLELAENGNRENLAPPNTTTLPPQQMPRKKVPLSALVTALLVSLGLISVAALAARSPQFAAYPPDYGQIPQKKGKVAYFPYQEGKDSKGRTAEFNIAILSKYKWLLGSEKQIKHKNKIINIDDLRANLEQEGIQTIMENPTEIISVGTAVCEGTPEIDERKAFERAKQTQVLVKKLFFHVSSVKDYRLLNLGQFRRQDCQSKRDLTAYQRSIIIIGVRKKSEGVILDEALRNRLRKKPFADFKLKDYSLGSAEKFKTIPSNF
jgi:eukaryotic-like serine/threonine-protein kinase